MLRRETAQSTGPAAGISDASDMVLRFVFDDVWVRRDCREAPQPAARLIAGYRFQARMLASTMQLCSLLLLLRWGRSPCRRLS
jgi:hypothetical protein